MKATVSIRTKTESRNRNVDQAGGQVHGLGSVLGFMPGLRD